MKKVLPFLFLFCTVLFVAASTFAGSVIIGQPPDPGSGNCFPFSCAYNGEYQQVYTHSAFGGGPITINALQFFNTQVDFGASSMSTGTFTISLSETTADWNSLSGNFASNIGGDNTMVFSGSLAQPWSFGDTLTIPLSTSFTYNPGSGLNLLMDVMVSGASDGGGDIYFDTNGYDNGNFDGNTIMGRVYCPSGNCANGTAINNGYGLETGFGTSTSQTPEPSSLILLGTGLLGLAGTLRRRFGV